MILAHTGQLFGVSAFAAAMIDSPADVSQMSSICHGNNDRTMVRHHENGDDASAGALLCCDEGCSVLNCHAASAILGSFNTMVLVPSHSVNFFVRPAFISESVSSLYRPPILG